MKKLLFGARIARPYGADRGDYLRDIDKDGLVPVDVQMKRNARVIVWGRHYEDTPIMSIAGWDR